MTRYAAGMQRMLGRRGGVVVALVLLLALLVPATALAVPTPGTQAVRDRLSRANFFIGTPFTAV